MSTVKQPDKAPTNKLTAAIVVSAVMGWIGLAVQNVMPEWYDAVVWANTEPFLIALVGYYLVRDRPNA